MALTLLWLYQSRKCSTLYFIPWVYTAVSNAARVSLYKRLITGSASNYHATNITSPSISPHDPPALIPTSHALNFQHHHTYAISLVKVPRVNTCAGPTRGGKRRNCAHVHIQEYIEEERVETEWTRKSRSAAAFPTACARPPTLSRSSPSLSLSSAFLFLATEVWVYLVHARSIYVGSCFWLERMIFFLFCF